MNITKNIKLSFTISFIFILILVLSFLTPLHSDDFLYAEYKFNLAGFYDIYLNWTGRMIAEIVSAALLKFGSPYKEILNSLALITLLFITTKILFQKKNVNPHYFILVFLLLWCGNPNLGQTFFWIVGAGNYLWTAIFYLSFIFFVLRGSSFYKLEVNFYILLVFAFFAGFTNENISITLHAFMLLIFLYDKFINHYKFKKFFYVWGSLLLGSMSLILAPGNFARAALDKYADFNEMSFIYKFFHHLGVRIPWAMGKVGLLLFIFTIFLIASKYLKFKTEKIKRDQSILFFLLYLIANQIMFVAPIMPTRSIFGSSIFLILSLLFYIEGTTFPKKLLLALKTLLILYFIGSYTLMTKAYYYTKLQEGMREEMIKEAFEKQESEINLPDFYFTKLISSRHKFDTYYSVGAIASYYGLEKVNIIPIDFNYGDLHESDYSEEYQEGKYSKGPFYFKGKLVYFR